jgi:hypothetical protein
VGTVLAAAVLAVVAGGCASGEYDRASVEQDLVDTTELTAAQAACLTRRLEATIGVTRLGARDEPTAGERDRMHGALVMSVLGCSGAPYAADAIVTDLAEAADLGRDAAQCLVDEVEREESADGLAKPDAVDDERAVALGAAISVATLRCGGGETELRRNAGLTGTQAECVLDARDALETDPVGTYEDCTAPE